MSDLAHAARLFPLSSDILQSHASSCEGPLSSKYVLQLYESNIKIAQYTLLFIRAVVDGFGIDGSAIGGAAVAASALKH